MGISDWSSYECSSDLHVLDMQSYVGARSPARYRHPSHFGVGDLELSAVPGHGSSLSAHTPPLGRTRTNLEHQSQEDGGAQPSPEAYCVSRRYREACGMSSTVPC